MAAATIESRMDAPPESAKKKRLGLIARIRTRNQPPRSQPLDSLDNHLADSIPQRRDPYVPPYTDEEEMVNVATIEKRVVTPPKVPKEKKSTNRKQKKLPFREEVILDKAPPAREAAFGGPPRYDWIDIETSAAIKVQAAYRRNKVLSDLEKQGLSTAAIRNRSRRRKAMSGGGRGHFGTDDIPGLFRCCGIGLAFGDATEEDYDEMRKHEKAQYEERKKARETRELQLRSHYRRKPNVDNMEEAYEIVE